MTNKAETIKTLALVIVALISGLVIGYMRATHLVAQNELTCTRVDAYGTSGTVCYNPKKCDINGCRDDAGESGE